MGPILCSPQALRRHQEAAQIRDVCTAFGGNMVGSTDIDTDHCCFKAMNLDMALSSTMGRDRTIDSGVSTCHSSGCSTLPSGFQLLSSSQCTNHSLSIPLLHHILALLNGEYAQAYLWVSSATWLLTSQSQGFFNIHTPQVHTCFNPQSKLFPCS